MPCAVIVTENRFLQRILRVFGRLLGFRGVWPIELIQILNIALATAMVFDEAPPPRYISTLCYDMACIAAAVAPVVTR